MCSIDDCDRPRHRRGYCAAHYGRLRVHGDPLGGGRSYPPRGSVKAAFLSAIESDASECLPWGYYHDKDGYALMGRGKRVAREVCIATQGPPPFKRAVAAHRCGNAGCINPKHIRWLTQQENIDEKKLHGTNQAGERHNLAKLTEAQVREIRLLRGYMTQIEVGAKFGISQSNVGMIQRRQTWREVA